MKEAMEYLVNAYVEQFVVTVKVLYNLQVTEPLKYCSELSTQKKLAECKADMKTAFTSSKNQVIEGIKKDKQTYLKFS
jgi:hypothetical protein